MPILGVLASAITGNLGLSVDYLVVAGGGGGGGWLGGGAGAGGLRSTVTATGRGGSLEAALSMALNTSFTVTVGAGGAGGAYGNPAEGIVGSNSVFSTITSNGGGYGGAGGGYTSTVGGNGGSGGGGGGATNTRAGELEQPIKVLMAEVVFLLTMLPLAVEVQVQ